MARTLHKLTNRTIEAVKKPGRISDGGGLFLRVKPSSLAKSWSFMWTRDGDRKELGLGPFPEVSLAHAREIASEYRTLIAKGGDPAAERAKASEPTFAECADAYIKSMETGWSNPKHRQQWRQTLGKDYCREISATPVSEITLADVLAVLKPIWTDKPETASRIRGRIERVLNYAKAHGWRVGENPALWRGNLDNVLPKRDKRKTVKHHAAMPYGDVPAFIEKIRQREAVSARALEFLILTAARTGEVIGARWSEVDFDKAVWTIPAKRMKLRREHQVPLTNQALDLLRPLYEARVSDWVFPGLKDNRPLSNMAMQLLLRRIKATDFTVHGFRSSFRDWAGDETNHPREVAEGCLAHLIGNETERSYRRRDAIEKRRQLLIAWANYCTNPNYDNVVHLVAS